MMLTFKEELEQIQREFEILKDRLEKIRSEVEKADYKLPSVGQIMASTEHSRVIPLTVRENHISKIRAISDMMWVADYLNEGWQVDWENESQEKWGFYISDGILRINCKGYNNLFFGIVFKSKDLAEKARQVLGDGLIKTAMS